MANLNLTDAQAILKRLYQPNKIGDVVSDQNALLNLVPKNKKLTGRSQIVPVQSGYPQNNSATDTIAFSSTLSTSSAVFDSFEMTPVRMYGRATIDGQAMRLSENEMGSFIKTASAQIDGSLKSRAALLETHLFRSGWGDIGVIAAGGVSGSTFTLATTDDVVNFEKGMNLVFAASQSSDALRSATPIKITGVNRSTGVITCDTALATPGALAGDYVFIAGDRQNSATPTRIVCAGLDAWIPQSAPGSTSFYGVDRSTDPTRLGGLRLDATGGDLIEIVNTAAGLTDRECRVFTHLFMSPTLFAQYVNALGTKVQYQGVNLKGSDELTVGVSGIKVLSNFGEIKVVPARKCPTTKMYGLNLNTWELASKGEPVGLLDDDVKMLRVPGEDTYEVRIGGDVNFHTNEPGSNIVIYNVGQ